MATKLITSLAFFLSLLSTFPLLSQPLNFTYHGFNNRSNLIFQQRARLEPSGVLRLTDTFHNVIGHVFHSTPIQIFNTTTKYLSSFSTKFVFTIVTPGGNPGGYGLAFTMSPGPQFPGGQEGHYLGILNSFNDGNMSNHIFAVEFDTVSGFNRGADSNGNHVGLNNNSMTSFASEPAAYFVNNSNVKLDMTLNSGELIQAWVDYDGIKKVINVTIAPSSVPKPIKPLMSELPVDLSHVVNEEVYIGFSASTGQNASYHYILGWSFRLNGLADEFDPSSLPRPPPLKKSDSFKPQIKVLIAALSVITVIMFLALLVITFYRRTIMFESNLEAWELDCPHRFKYKDLYKATKGFKESELVGIGGFGAVYRGVVPSTGSEIAVKRIMANNQIQGVREFVAEIESLGRLRHKHLVNLQGWCKRKNDLLLVYEYVPNGSLDSLLLNPRNGAFLNWEQRFKILKGIASGLLYLHEEWEQVVIHRDIKSSNVLIDGEMNGKLGDFGLARLYGHGQQNSQTTSVVGTIGYIAPELTQTGKASTSSDVFAFGVLLLEVVCGRGPVVRDEEQDHVILVDWVIGCMRTGRVLDSVDPRLGEDYVREEVEMVLGLGLLCSHSRPEARPSMRQIMRYFNGDESLNVFDKVGSIDSRGMDEITSRFLERVSSDIINTSSYGSFSIGDMSSSSLKGGR